MYHYFAFIAVLFARGWLAWKNLLHLHYMAEAFAGLKLIFIDFPFTSKQKKKTRRNKTGQYRKSNSSLSTRGERYAAPRKRWKIITFRWLETLSRDATKNSYKLKTCGKTWKMRSIVAGTNWTIISEEHSIMANVASWWEIKEMGIRCNYKCFRWERQGDLCKVRTCKVNDKSVEFSLHLSVPRMKVWI